MEERMSTRSWWENDTSSQGRNSYSSNNYQFQDTTPNQPNISPLHAYHSYKEQVQAEPGMIGKDTIRVVHVPGSKLPNHAMDFQHYNSNNPRAEFEASSNNLNNTHNYYTVSAHSSTGIAAKSPSGNTPSYSNPFIAQRIDYQQRQQQQQQLQQQHQQQQQHPSSSSSSPQHQSPPPQSFQIQSSHPYIASHQPTHNSSSLHYQQPQFPTASFQQQTAAQQLAMLQRIQDNSQQQSSSQQQYYSQPLSNPLVQPQLPQQQQQQHQGYILPPIEAVGYLHQMPQTNPQQQQLPPQTPFKVTSIYASQPPTAETSVTLNNPQNSHSVFGRKTNPMRCSSSCKPLAAQQQPPLAAQQQQQQQRLQPSISSHGGLTQQPTTETLTNNKENLKFDMFFNSPRPKQFVQQEPEFPQSQEYTQLLNPETQRIIEQINIKTRERQDSEQSQNRSQLNFDDRQLLARYEKQSPQSRLLFPQNHTHNTSGDNHNPYASYYFQSQGKQQQPNEQQQFQQINQQQDYHHQQQQQLQQQHQHQPMISRRDNESRSPSQKNTANSLLEQFQLGSAHSPRYNHSLAPQSSYSSQNSMNMLPSQQPQSSHYVSPHTTNSLPQEINLASTNMQQQYFQLEQTQPQGNSSSSNNSSGHDSTEGTNVRVIRYSSRDPNALNQGGQQQQLHTILGDTANNNSNQENFAINEQNNKDRSSSSPSSSSPTSTQYSASTTTTTTKPSNHSAAAHTIQRKQIHTSFKKSSAAVTGESSSNSPTKVFVATAATVNSAIIRVNSSNNDAQISVKEDIFSRKQNENDNLCNKYCLSAQQYQQSQPISAATVTNTQEKPSAVLSPTGGLQNIADIGNVFPIVMHSTQGFFDDCVSKAIERVEHHEIQEKTEQQLPELIIPPESPPVIEESEKLSAAQHVMDSNSTHELEQIPSNSNQQTEEIEQANLIEDTNTASLDANPSKLPNPSEKSSSTSSKVDPPKVSLSNFITQVHQNAPQICFGGSLPSGSSNVNIPNGHHAINNPSNKQGHNNQHDNPQEVSQTTQQQQADNQDDKEESKEDQHSLQAMNHIISLPERQSTSGSNESANEGEQGSLEQETNNHINKTSHSDESDCQQQQEHNNQSSHSDEPDVQQQQEVNKEQDIAKIPSDSIKGHPLPLEQLYYASSLLHAFQNPSDLAVMSTLARDHLLQTMQSVNLSRTITPPTMEQIESKRVFLPPIKENITKTLIFDLDETLVHCNEDADLPSDITIDITFPTGEQVKAGINIRPYAIECLKELSELYEIIVFTASHSCYANVVLDYLDPEKKYISYRLFREHCVNTQEGVNVKDLRVIGNRKIENMLLVDNAAYSFGFQVDNGIPILPFYDHEHDIELKHLIAYLKNLYLVEDAREHNKKTLKISQFSEYEDPSLLLRALYPELHSYHDATVPNDGHARDLTVVA